MKVATPGSPLNTTFAVSPQNREDAGLPDVIILQSKPLSGKETLRLSWNGKSREDLAATLEAARKYHQQGDMDQAERDFIEAYEGFEHLLSSTHDETVQVAYNFAEFYAQQGRKPEADEILEALTQKHIDRWGIEHKKTQQLVLHVVELLNGWNRESDALAFVAHAWDIADSQEKKSKPQNDTVRRQKRRRGGRSNFPATGRERLQEMSEDVDTNANFNRIDHTLSVARVYVTANEPAVETFLKAIASVCARDPKNFAVQGIRTRGELLRLYLKQDKSDTIIDHGEAFVTACALLSTFWDGFSWNRKSPKSLDLLEASLELASSVLKGGFKNDAKRMFSMIEEKATNVFYDDDERTIWTFISIGLVYQNAKLWSNAKPWFERAFAAADARYGEEDGIYQSLELALEKSHFSYISDEGRPFKSIFGVCGLTIRPNRLHLE
jgi:tetratricopeptide (TPR) repeat protein